MPKARYVFIWENFGPQHHDRLNAVASHFGSTATVAGIELSERSGHYVWAHQANLNIDHYVVCRSEPHFFSRSIFFQLRHLIPLALRQGQAVYVLCHYEQPVIFLLACLLRLLRRHVIAMNDSKFDDRDRLIVRELIKFLLYIPYQGAIVASERSASYLHFLGIPRQFIRLNYDNLSRDRIRTLARHLPDQDAIKFEDRNFVIIARLIEKKNLFRTLDAYRCYRKSAAYPRRLIIIGYGTLEDQLKDYAKKLAIEHDVEFTGPLQTDEVVARLKRALALLLLSTEEQFGHVVLEAQALSIPVIVSKAVGAVDCFVRNNINGLIVDPHDIDEIAQMMISISDNNSLWTSLSKAAESFSEKGDARHFASSIDELMRSIKCF